MNTKTRNFYNTFFIIVLLNFACSHASWAEDITKTTQDQPTTPATQAETQQSKIRIEPNPQQSLLIDLSRIQNNQNAEVIQLNTDSDKFDAFYKESSGAITHGGVIILPDDRTHPKWPLITNPLRVGLTDFGWSTLAIALPPPVTPNHPIRTLPSLKVIKNNPLKSEGEPVEPTALDESIATPAIAKESKTTDSPIPQTYNNIMQRGTAAIQALQQKGINRIVLIGTGTGATWAAALAAKWQDQANFKLIIINAEQSSDISAPALLELIPELTLTTLDMYSANPKNASTTQKQQPRQRIETARRNQLNNYHQSRLPKITNKLPGQEWLVRYTRGLLTTYVINAEEKVINTPPAPPPSTNQQPGARKKQTPI